MATPLLVTSSGTVTRAHHDERATGSRRRGGLRRTSPSCPNFYDEGNGAAITQPAGFLRLLNQVGFSVRRNRPYVQTGIRTPRRTIRSEHSARTDAQTILVQR